MKISTQTRYALRFLLELSKSAADNKPTTLHQIALSQGISENYLESIATKLKRYGYLRSSKGNGGGYQLVRRPDDISLGEIMRLMESTYFQVHCTHDAENTCVNYVHCKQALAWENLEDRIDVLVNDIRLSELLENCSIQC